MTARSSESLSRIETIKSYFRKVGAGDPSLFDLFREDLRFFFPKYGRHTGKAALVEFGRRMGGDLESIGHDIDNFTYTVEGDRIVVEGREWGLTRKGVSWPDGTVSHGLFCSVFEFDGPLIARMHIYVDPDFTSAHADRIAVLCGETVGS